MAYDWATGQLVLIGGYRIVQPSPVSFVDTEAILNDTWVFAKGSWHQIHPRVSPPRDGGAGATGFDPTRHTDLMAYDPTRRDIILVTPPEFRSGTTHLLRGSTTWGWTGTQWSKLLSTGPVWGSIQQGELVFDPRTLQLVFTPSDGGSTWILGRSGWLRGAHAPSPLYTMAYDPLTRRLIGSSALAMWWWDGHRWNEYRNLPVVSDLPITDAVIGAPTGVSATDNATREIVVLGGYLGGPVPFAHPAHIFTWLSGAWRPIRTKIDPAPNNPGGFSFAYDGALQAMVAFGGDGGERTKSGAWVSGGNQTWVLTNVG
jgi:hypothetical protein